MAQLAGIRDWGGRFLVAIPSVRVPSEPRGPPPRHRPARMKVVLFCGGQGLRLREYADATIPKPMVPVGRGPILWHVMRYFAHFGHKDFILCLGYKGEVIKDYFLRYNEALSNDFVLSEGGAVVELLSTDIEDWRITFADTGLDAKIGAAAAGGPPPPRGRGDVPRQLRRRPDRRAADRLIDDFRSRDKVAAFSRVRPELHLPHRSRPTANGTVSVDPTHVRERDVWINGGYFIFRREIFDYIKPGEELVEEPFQRLIAEGQLLAYRYEGFWAPMDTLKDMQHLEALSRPADRRGPSGSIASGSVGRMTRRPSRPRPGASRWAGHAPADLRPGRPAGSACSPSAPTPTTSRSAAAAPSSASSPTDGSRRVRWVVLSARRTRAAEARRRRPRSSAASRPRSSSTTSGTATSPTRRCGQGPLRGPCGRAGGRPRPDPPARRPPPGPPARLAS